jgi:hypothetical protein
MLKKLFDSDKVSIFILISILFAIVMLRQAFYLIIISQLHVHDPINMILIHIAHCMLIFFERAWY